MLVLLTNAVCASTDVSWRTIHHPLLLQKAAHIRRHLRTTSWSRTTTLPGISMSRDNVLGFLGNAVVALQLGLVSADGLYLRLRPLCNITASEGVTTSNLPAMIIDEDNL